MLTAFGGIVVWQDSHFKPRSTCRSASILSAAQAPSTDKSAKETASSNFFMGKSFFLIAGDRRLSAPALFSYDQGVSLATVLPAILPNTQASELLVAP